MAIEVSLLPAVEWVGYVQPHHKVRGSLSKSKSTTLPLNTSIVLSFSTPHPLSNIPYPDPPSLLQEACLLLSLDCSHLSMEYHHQPSTPLPPTDYIHTKAIKARIAFTSTSPSTLTLTHTLSHHYLQTLTTHLTKLPSLSSLEHHTPIITHNHYARGVLLSGIDSLLSPTSPPSPIPSSLLGLNQVVGVTDSGVDYRNCFFSNTDDSPPPFRTWKASPSSSDMMSPSSLVTQRKIVSYVTYSDSLDEGHGDHGTHVAGSVSGYPVSPSSTLEPYSGMAIASKLAVFDIGSSSGSLQIPVDMSSHLFPWLYAAGARILTNSWGSSSDADYTSLSEEVDDYMYSNKDVLILFSAENKGDCSTYTSTVYAPGNAKNCITVGASLNSYTSWEEFGGSFYDTFSPSSPFDETSMAFFSSVGPTLDGRIKPEVTAPGYVVYSANNDQSSGPQCSSFSYSVVPNAGTSMSTPLLAGIASLIRDYLTSGYYPTGESNGNHSFTPSGGLLKNLLVHGGVAMAGDKISYSFSSPACSFEGPIPLVTPPPTTVQGFGRTQLDTVLYFPSSPHNLHIPSLTPSSPSTFYDRTIAQGVSHTYTYCIPSTATLTSTKVSLLWIDPPPSPLSSSPLINNLNLVLTSTSISTNTSTLYRGNGVLDSTNTVESVLVEGVGMEIVIEVEGEVVSVLYGGGVQPYSLVVSGELVEGSCTPGAVSSQPSPVFTESSLLGEVSFNFTVLDTDDGSGDGDSGLSVGVETLLIGVGAVVVVLAVMYLYSWFTSKGVVPQSRFGERGEVDQVQLQRMGEV